MPLYEYKCLRCGTTFEIIQRFNDEPVKRCINCGGPVQKLISPSTLQFRGEGWYVTDYAKNKKSEKKEKEKEKPKDKPKDKEKASPKKNSE